MTHYCRIIIAVLQKINVKTLKFHSGFKVVKFGIYAISPISVYRIRRLLTSYY